MSPKIKQSNGATIPFVPYSKCSRKVFFEYSPEQTSFQLGYLGANKSTIEGVLRLRYTDDKPIFAKKIIISFVGKEYVFFKGTLEEGQDIKDDDESGFYDYDDDDDVSTKTISSHTAKRKFFDNNLVIWRSQSKGHYEGVKYLDLPFKFNLPNNLPPSVTMDKGCGRIYYLLKAVISRRPIDPNSTVRKKVIKIIVPIVRFTITPEPDNFRWFAKEEGPAKTHVVGYDVSLTRSIFEPGESVTIPIKLFFHEPHAYLKNIFVGLKEYHELRTDRYETLTKNYIFEETLKADVISESNNECSVQVKFIMPSARQLVYSMDSTYLTVSHKLKFKFSLGRAPDVHLSKFVQIDNIVSNDEAFPPTPPPIDIPQAIVTHEPIIVKPKRESLRRLSPFFPLFDKIHNKELAPKRISLQIQKLQLQQLRQLQTQIRITDSKNPNMIYNSRSLIKPCTKSENHQQQRPNRVSHAY